MQKSITAYCCSFFHFRQAFLSSVLIAHVNNRQSRPLGKIHALTGEGLLEASAALRRERRPGRRGTEAATRTAAPGTAHPDGPSGRSERRRNSGGCRTPGLLRGWREPLNPTACTDRLKPHRLAGGIFSEQKPWIYHLAAPGKTPPNKEQDPTGGGFPEASAALRRERRPGRRGREAATRTAAPGMAHPDGPSGRSE